MPKFSLRKTENRKGAHYDYIVRIRPDDRNNAGIGRFAVLGYVPAGLTNELLVPCRVVKDTSLPLGNIAADQTLRNAIAIDQATNLDEVTVELHPLGIEFWVRLRSFVSWLFGRRYLFFRVCPAHVLDMEKHLCRIPDYCFKLLGFEEGDKLVLESVATSGNEYLLKTRSLRAFSIPDEVLADRKDQEECSLEARYPAAQGLLGVDPDIGRIFLDSEDRNTLQTDNLFPLRVRRSIWNQCLKEVREFGIVLLLSVLTLITAFTRAFQIGLSGESLALVLVISLIFTISIVLIRITAGLR